MPDDDHISDRRFIKEMRQSLGLKEDDPSRDAEIERMSPRTRFGLLCGWFLGDSGWAYTVLNWAEAAGMKVDKGNDHAYPVAAA